MFTCIKKQNNCDFVYWNIHFIGVVCNWTHNIPKVCLCCILWCSPYNFQTYRHIFIASVIWVFWRDKAILGNFKSPELQSSEACVRLLVSLWRTSLDWSKAVEPLIIHLSNTFWIPTLSKVLEIKDDSSFLNGFVV